MQNAELLTVVTCAAMVVILVQEMMLWRERKDNRKEQRHLVSQLMSLMELEPMPAEEEDNQAAKRLKEVTSPRSTRSTGSSLNFKMPDVTHPPKRIQPLGND